MFLALLLAFLLGVPSLEAGEVVLQTERLCEEDTQTCLVMSDCPYYQEKVEYTRSLSEGDEQRSLTRFLKDQVCNKNLKAFCCPCTSGDICKPSKECNYTKRKLEKYKQIKNSSPNEAASIIRQLKQR